MGENDVLKVHIINGEFDFTEFFDECDKYGRSKRLSVKEINMVQLMIEETVVNHIMKHAADIHFSIICKKDSGKVQIDYVYDGEPYNLYTAERQDSLSLVIIKCLTKRCVYRHDGYNQLSLVMQFGVGEEPEVVEE